MFGPDVLAAAQAHALEVWPHESCGVVSKGVYVPVLNVSPDPFNAWQMPEGTWLDLEPEAVIHSHDGSTIVVNGVHQPKHPHYPSADDMASQISTGVPYGIISTDGQTASEILWWGDLTLDAPLIGRSFVPGIYDCYALVRAWYHQVRGITLPDFARDDGWWRTGENLLVDNFGAAGFHEIDASEVREGDVCLMRVMAKVPCHSGVILGDGLLLHHLDTRLSCREPLGNWRKRITHWVRYAS